MDISDSQLIDACEVMEAFLTPSDQYLLQAVRQSEKPLVDWLLANDEWTSYSPSKCYLFIFYTIQPNDFPLYHFTNIPEFIPLIWTLTEICIQIILMIQIQIQVQFFISVT